jgi:hypothetical protein
MTSLEDTTKRHYMYPYDPDYVHEMSQKGFDPHLDLAKHAGAITQSDIDAYNRENRDDLKAMRKNYKVVNYSATYGVGAAKLSRTTGMLYLKHNHCLMHTGNVTGQSKHLLRRRRFVRSMMRCGYKILSVSFWHSLRYEKDVFSTLNQSTGAYCFDKWVAITEHGDQTSSVSFMTSQLT